MRKRENQGESANATVCKRGGLIDSNEKREGQREKKNQMQSVKAKKTELTTDRGEPEKCKFETTTKTRRYQNVIFGFKERKEPNRITKTQSDFESCQNLPQS